MAGNIRIINRFKVITTQSPLFRRILPPFSTPLSVNHLVTHVSCEWLTQMVEYTRVKHHEGVLILLL